MNKKINYKLRKQRTKAKIKPKSPRPILRVFRSNKNIYAQIIDDISGKTIASASSLGQDNKSSAKDIGNQLGEKAIKANVKEVVFDRGRYAYHGKIKEIAEASRQAGLKF